MAARLVSEGPLKYENGHNSSIFEARSQTLASVDIFRAVRNTLEWLLCKSNTTLAYNSKMAARLVSEGPLKYENGHNSSIFEARSQTLTSVDIFHAMRNTLEWLLCESNTTLAYNSNMAAR